MAVNRIVLATTLAFCVAWDGFSYTGGTVHRIDRKFIVQVRDDVTMEAYYKDIDVLIHPINVSWYKNSKKLPLGRRFKLTNNNTVLRIKDVQITDKGEYQSVLVATNTTTFITDFTLVVHKRPIPQWAVALIIVGLVFVLAAAVAFFKCRRQISEVVVKRIPRRKKKTCTFETSFQE